MTEPVADLNLIAWRDRIATLCPDSDVSTNEHVRAAFSGLAIEIHRRGAQSVYRTTLPPDAAGEKQGLEIFCTRTALRPFWISTGKRFLPPSPR